MRLPPPDPLSKILLYMGALTMALNAALAPKAAVATRYPSLAMTGLWPYVPVGLMSAAFFVWILRGFWGAPTPSPPIGQAPQRIVRAPRAPLFNSDQWFRIVIMVIMYGSMMGFMILNHLTSGHPEKAAAVANAKP